MPKAVPIKQGRLDEGGGYRRTHDPGVSAQRSVANQVDQYMFLGIEMDDNVSSAELGLTGEEAEAIRKMRPDVHEIAQGEEAKKDRTCSHCASTISIASHNCRYVLYPPHIGPRGGQEDRYHWCNSV